MYSVITGATYSVTTGAVTVGKVVSGVEKVVIGAAEISSVTGKAKVVTGAAEMVGNVVIGAAANVSIAIGMGVEIEELGKRLAP
jgi:hypothetical protein